MEMEIQCESSCLKEHIQRRIHPLTVSIDFNVEINVQIMIANAKRIGRERGRTKMKTTNRIAKKAFRFDTTYYLRGSSPTLANARLAEPSTKYSKHPNAIEKLNIALGTISTYVRYFHRIFDCIGNKFTFALLQNNQF